GRRATERAGSEPGRWPAGTRVKPVAADPWADFPRQRSGHEDAEASRVEGDTWIEGEAGEVHVPRERRIGGDCLAAVGAVAEDATDPDAGCTCRAVGARAACRTRGARDARGALGPGRAGQLASVRASIGGDLLVDRR